MSESKDAQIVPRESREPTPQKEGGTPLSLQETRKSGETAKREKLQRQVRAVIEEAREQLKPKAKKMGEDRKKRRDELKNVLTRKKVEVDGEELKLSEAVVKLTEAIAKDDSSPEQSLVMDLRVSAKELEDNPEYGWILAKVVSLNEISGKTGGLFVVALEAAHRGGPEAKPLLKAIVSKLVVLLRKSKKNRADLKDKASEILELIMQAEAGEIPWSVVIGKYGVLQEGDLWERRKTFEEISRGEVNEKNIKLLMGVEGETETDAVFAEMRENIRRREDLLSRIPTDKPPAEQLEYLARGLPVEISRLLRNASLQLRNPSKEGVNRLMEVVTNISGLNLAQAGVGEEELREMQDKKQVSLMLLRSAILELGQKFGFSKEEIAQKLGGYEVRAQRVGVDNIGTRFLEEITRLMLQEDTEYDSNNPDHVRLHQAIVEAEFLEANDMATVSRLEKLLEKVKEASLGVRRFDTLRDLQDRFGRAIQTKMVVLEQRKREREKEEQRQERTQVRHPYKPYLEARREDLRFEMPTGLDRLGARQREGLNGLFMEISDRLRGRIEDDELPPFSDDIKEFKTAIEKIIAGYKEDSPGQSGLLEEIENRTIEQLERIGETAGEIRAAVGPEMGRERWFSGALEPEDIEMLRKPKTAEEWFRDRLREIEKEEKASTHGEGLRGISSKLHMGLQHLRESTDSYWKSSRGREKIKELEKMTHNRMHLHDVFIAYKGEDIKTIQTETSLLGIEGVVESQGMFSGPKVQVAKDTFLLMLKRVQTQKVKLEDVDSDYGEKGQDYIIRLRITPREHQAAVEETIQFLSDRQNLYGFVSEEEVREVVPIAVRCATAEHEYVRVQAKGMIEGPKGLNDLQVAGSFESEYNRIHIESLNFAHNLLKWHKQVAPYEATMRDLYIALGEYRALFWTGHKGKKYTEAELVRLGIDEFETISKAIPYWDSSWKRAQAIRSIENRYTQWLEKDRVTKRKWNNEEIQDESGLSDEQLEEILQVVQIDDVEDLTSEQRRAVVVATKEKMERYQSNLAIGMKLKKEAGDYYKTLDDFLILEDVKKNRHLQKRIEQQRQNRGKSYKQLVEESKQDLFEEEYDSETGEPITARAKFLTMLSKAIKTRPLEIARILANDRDFNDVFLREISARGGYFADIESFIELEQKLGNVLYPIYKKVLHPVGIGDAPLAKEGKRHLFISKETGDLTAEEREWVLREIEASGESVDPEQFLGVLDDLHNYLQGRRVDMIDNPLFHRDLNSVLFIDDVPFANMEDTEIDYELEVADPRDARRKIKVRVNHKKVRPFSKEILEGGFRNGLVRGNNDIFTGHEVSDKMAETTLESDPEQVYANGMEAVSKAKGYESPTRMASVGVVIAHRWSEVRADRWAEALGLAEKLPFMKTSDAQRDFGFEARSLTRQQLLEMYKKIASHYGSPELIYPGMAKYFKNRLNFTFYGTHVDTMRFLFLLGLMGFWKLSEEIFEKED